MDSQRVSAGLGYPCMYPRCKERRSHFIDLVYHTEQDHSDPRVLESRILRDPRGNILALPPQLIFQYFPEVGPKGTTAMTQSAVTPATDPFLSENLNPDNLGVRADGGPTSYTHEGSVQPFQPKPVIFASPSPVRPLDKVTLTAHPSGEPLNALAHQPVGNVTSVAYHLDSSLTGGLPKIQTLGFGVSQLQSRFSSAPSPDSGRGSETSLDDSSPSPLAVSAKKLGENGDSNDSWTFPEDYSVESVVKLSRQNAEKFKDTEKPYKCVVDGCEKSYKNLNGVRYHAKTSHRVKKAFRCLCDKKFATEEAYQIHRAQCSAQCGGPTRPVLHGGNSVREKLSATPTLHRLLSTPATPALPHQ